MPKDSYFYYIHNYYICNNPKSSEKKSKQDDDLPNGDSTSGDIKLEERRI